MKFFLFILLLCPSVFALLPATPAVDLVFRSVVFLKIPGTDTDGTSVDGLCNGTLISADTLVTAAHCLAGSTLNRGDQLTVEVGQYKYFQRPDGSVVRVGYAAFIKHLTKVTAQFPNGVNYNSPANKISPDNDFVLVRLHTALSLPNDFIFAKIWNRSISGLTLSSPFVVSINPLEYISTTDTKQMAQLNNIKFSTYQAKSQSTSRVAEGDSGAPLFANINNQLYLVGVTKGRATTMFSNWDVFAIWGERLAF